MLVIKSDSFSLSKKKHFANAEGEYTFSQPGNPVVVFILLVTDLQTNMRLYINPEAIKSIFKALLNMCVIEKQYQQFHCLISEYMIDRCMFFFCPVCDFESFMCLVVSLFTQLGKEKPFTLVSTLC